MPSQNDFERAAGVFDRSAQHIDELFTEPRRLLDEGVLVGGLITIELNLLFDHVCRALDRHASELREFLRWSAAYERRRARVTNHSCARSPPPAMSIRQNCAAGPRSRMPMSKNDDDCVAVLISLPHRRFRPPGRTAS